MTDCKNEFDVQIVTASQRVEEAHRRIDQLDALYRDGAKTLASLHSIIDRAGARYDAELKEIDNRFSRLYDKDLKSFCKRLNDVDKSIDTLIEFQHNLKGFARVVGFLSVLAGLIYSLVKLKSE